MIAVIAIAGTSEAAALSAPAPPFEVVFGLGDAPTGCATGCITDVDVEQLAPGSIDTTMTVHTNTPVEVIVAMMALGQGDSPAGGDPYAASHGLVTDWSIDLVDLLPGTTYEYAVIAIDEHGGTDTFGGTFTTTLPIAGKAVVPMNPDEVPARFALAISR